MVVELSPEMILSLGRLVVSHLLRDVFAAGHSVSLYNGDEFTVKHSRDMSEVLGALCTVDEERLYIFDSTGKRLGWVFLVHGNSGHDVIADYHTALEPLMAGANKASDDIQELFSVWF